MTRPVVASAVWNIWLARFPDAIPAAYDAPATFRRAVDRAASAALPDRALLSAAERTLVAEFLAATASDILQPAASQSLFAAVLSASGGLLGLGAYIAPLTLGAPAVLIGAALALYGLAEAGIRRAGDAGAEVVATRLREIIRHVR